MEATINIEDYLTPDDIKAECKEAIKHCIYNQYDRDEEQLRRLIVNLSYEYVYQMVDDAIGGNLEKKIKENVTKAIDEMSFYTVFRAKEAWRSESKGYQIMEQEVERQREHIKMRIYEIIEQYDYPGIKNSIGDMIYECIDNKLFSSK